MDLLTDRGIFAGGNGVREGRIEPENIFGVKIVNAGTCDEDVTVKIVNTDIWDGKGNFAVAERSNHGIGRKWELMKVRCRGTA